MTNRRDSAESQGKGRAASERTDSSKRSDPGGRKSRVATLHGAQGNQAVQELARQGAIQPKLTVSDPADASEREAERVAETVLAADESVQSAETDVAIQPSDGDVGGTAVDDGLQREIQSVTSGGQPLSQETRGYFETRFGRDFGDVRIHTGGRADGAARSIDAEAFTYGTDIVFRSGAYQPGTRAGKRLLAHELTHVVQSSGGGRSVYRSPVSEEERDEAIRFTAKVGTVLDLGKFKPALEGQIKEIVEQYDFTEIEKEIFEHAIREGELKDFVNAFGVGYEASRKKLVTVIRAKNILSQLEDFREEHDQGFEYDETKISELKDQVADIQEEIDITHIVRKQALASLFDDMKFSEAMEKTRTLNQYLQSETFRTELERTDPDRRSEFVKEKLAVLGAMAPKEVASETARKAIGTLFKVESERKLLLVDDGKRTAALEKVLEGEGDSDSTFKQILDAVGTSGTTAGIAQKLNEALNEMHGDPGKAKNWIAALDTLPGSKSVQAKAFVQRLESSGKLNTFIAATVLLSMEWPDDVQESIELTGSVAALASTTPDIARVLGMTDLTMKITEFGRALKFLGEWMGPVGDVVTSIADSISAYQQYEEGDAGAAIGSGVSALGGGAGLAIAAGTSWTGVGILVGLGVGLIGAGIGWLWGESPWETKLEDLGLIRDTDTYMLPG